MLCKICKVHLPIVSFVKIYVNFLSRPDTVCYYHKLAEMLLFKNSACKNILIAF